MNYREKIRKAIECPQFGYATYGEWGALNLEQRRYIKRLLDELDSADNYIKNVYLENQKYKEVIDKLKNKTKENIENAKCEITTLTIVDKAYYQYIEKILDNYVDILKEVE